MVAADNTQPAIYSRAEAMRQYARPSTIPFPADNAYTTEREELGRTLFFDPRLSRSGIESCATCHNPAFGWGDGLPKGVGHDMKPLARRTPTILNDAWAELLFWDGRAGSLEEQALGPIQSAAEMNMPMTMVIDRILRYQEYREMFAKAYPGEPAGGPTIAKAIATFERTVVSGTAPFDRWIAGDETAISESAKIGFDLFNTKAECAKCHSSWNFTDYGFHDIGVQDGDMGRGARLKVASMQHAFKTPTLRNVVRRAPFMHDGSEATLADVLELYNAGGRQKRPSLAEEIKPLHLSSDEKQHLLDFLATLSSVDKAVTIPLEPTTIAENK